MTSARCDRYEEAFRRQLQELGEDPERIAPWLSPEKLLSMYSKGFAKYMSMVLEIAQVGGNVKKLRSKVDGTRKQYISIL